LRIEGNGSIFFPLRGALHSAVAAYPDSRSRLDSPKAPRPSLRTYTMGVSTPIQKFSRTFVLLDQIVVEGLHKLRTDSLKEFIDSDVHVCSCLFPPAHVHRKTYLICNSQDSTEYRRKETKPPTSGVRNQETTISRMAFKSMVWIPWARPAPAMPPIIA